MPKFPTHPERRPAVVTGASSGIGAATARLLAAHGHPVVLGARRADRCEEVAAGIRADGGEAVAVPLDMASAGSVKDFSAAASEAFGAVEVLVSNAGGVHFASGIDTAPDDFAAEVQVNLLGVQRLVSLQAPPMRERQRGDLVFITSDTVRAPRPEMASYVSSKWGLEGFVRVLQMELEGTGVRASIVRPGPALTEMGWDADQAALSSALEAWMQWGIARHSSYLRPEQVAEAVLAVVRMPRGSHLTLVEVEPEAPISEGGTE